MGDGSYLGVEDRVFEYRLGDSAMHFPDSRYYWLATPVNDTHIHELNIGITPRKMPNADLDAFEHRLQTELSADGWVPGHYLAKSEETVTPWGGKRTTGEGREYFRPNAWPNTPDILTAYLQNGGRPAFMTRLVLAATLAANYGIYGPAYELCENRPREDTRRASRPTASTPTIVASAAAAGSSVSSALRDPGSRPSHIGTPISTTAATFTALVSRNTITERLAMRPKEIPRVRRTHAPSAMPARPLTDTTEFTASSASARRFVRRPPRPPNTRSNSTT